MSVLIPDLKIYQAVASKMFDASFRTTCDINHFSSCFSFTNPLTEDRIWKLVKTWLTLNENSCDARYREESNQKPLTFFLKERFVSAPDTYQFLKWLQCIKYNIELSTIETVREITEDEREAYKFLSRLIDEAKMAIIDSLPEYKAATWSEMGSNQADIMRRI